MCPACGAAGHEFLKANDERLGRYLQYSRLKYGGLLDDWLDELQLIVCACRRCGHHWYRDQPTAEKLHAMYAAGRPLIGNEPSKAPTREILTSLRQLRRLVAHKTIPTFLDYGSGFGRWARAAAELGFVVCAYEPSQTRGKDDDPPFRLAHNWDELEDRTFDVVNIEQVLEHVPDPLGTLKAIHAVCVDDTVVRITVPNLLRSPEGAKLWQEWPFDGRRPHTMAPFEHLHGFTPQSIALLAQRAGFRHLPAMRLASSHLSLVGRRIAGRLWHRLGQTLVLCRPR